MDYYNPVIDYYNNPLLRFELCNNQLGLILILCKISINLIDIHININVININPTLWYLLTVTYASDCDVTDVISAVSSHSHVMSAVCLS